MSDLYHSGVDPQEYGQLLEQKSQMLLQRLAGFQLPTLELFDSQPSHYRLRAEFRLWHSGDRCFYAMFDPEDRKRVLEVKDFPVASKLINQLMDLLLAEIHQSDRLKHKLFQVEFLTTLSGDALITLIYHKPLDEAWVEEATRLMTTLGYPIIGRSRKQKRVLERDWVTEQLNVDGQTYQYRQIEGGFTQPNGGMNEKMLSWARNVSNGLDGDLLELYCGNGNFSIALASQFNRVLATEISKTSVAAAQINIKDNGIKNLDILRLSSEEFVQAIQGERQFTRLADIDLQSYDFRTVLVDPPRAGLDDASVAQIKAYDQIIYISCNPNTLANNLNELTKTHCIKRLALFDQFPYTDHVETGVLLVKR